MPRVIVQNTNITFQYKYLLNIHNRAILIKISIYFCDIFQKTFIFIVSYINNLVCIKDYSVTFYYYIKSTMLFLLLLRRISWYFNFKNTPPGKESLKVSLFLMLMVAVNPFYSFALEEDNYFQDSQQNQPLHTEQAYLKTFTFSEDKLSDNKLQAKPPDAEGRPVGVEPVSGNEITAFSLLIILYVSFLIFKKNTTIRKKLHTHKK